MPHEYDVRDGKAPNVQSEKIEDTLSDHQKALQQRSGTGIAAHGDPLRHAHLRDKVAQSPGIRSMIVVIEVLYLSLKEKIK